MDFCCVLVMVIRSEQNYYQHKQHVQIFRKYERYFHLTFILLLITEAREVLVKNV